MDGWMMGGDVVAAVNGNLHKVMKQKAAAGSNARYSHQNSATSTPPPPPSPPAVFFGSVDVDEVEMHGR